MNDYGRNPVALLFMWLGMHLRIRAETCQLKAVTLSNLSLCLCPNKLWLTPSQGIIFKCTKLLSHWAPMICPERRTQRTVNLVHTVMAQPTGTSLHICRLLWFMTLIEAVQQFVRLCTWARQLLYLTKTLVFNSMTLPHNSSCSYSLVAMVVPPHSPVPRHALHSTVEKVTASKTVLNGGGHWEDLGITWVFGAIHSTQSLQSMSAIMCWDCYPDCHRLHHCSYAKRHGRTRS